MSLLRFGLLCLFCVTCTVADDSPGENKDNLRKRCNCSMLGTVEDKYGKSSCDEDGYCKCLANVVGKDCNACRNGYFGIFLGNGCTNCKCNAKGSDGIDCDKMSGQCYCKQGFTGFKCELCDLSTQEQFPTKCATPCKKNLSKHPYYLQQNGTCLCKLHAIGKECNKCEEHFYFNATKLACAPCHSCYMLVKQKVYAINDQLQNITKIINYHLTQPITDSNDYTFLLKAKILGNNICNVLGKLHKQPKTMQIVKLKHLDAILDIIDKEAKNILQYLNGYINYAYLEKLFTGLDETIAALEMETKECIGKHGVEKFAIEKELNSLEEERVMNKKEEIKLIKNVSNLWKTATEISFQSNITLMQLKQKELDLFTHLRKINQENFVGFTKLLMKEKDIDKETVLNKEQALSVKKAAEMLELPELPEIPEDNGNDLIPNYKDEIDNFLKETKAKFDAVHNLNKLIKDYDNIKDVIGKLLQNNPIDKNYEEISKTLKDLHSDMGTLYKNIVTLNNSIDEKQKALEETISNYDKQKELAEKHKQEMQNLNEIEKKAEELKKVLFKLKEDRAKLNQDVNYMSELLNKRKELEELIDIAIQTINEFKMFIKNYEEIIATMEELINYIQLIPVDEFQAIQVLINQWENYFFNLQKLKQEKIDLEEEVNKIEVLVNSLPDVCPYKWTVEA